MNVQFKAGLAVLALMLAPMAAQAHHKDSHERGGGNGNGNGAHSDNRGDNGGGNGNAFGRNRGGSDDVAEETARGGERPCGWGLANRDTPCVPPGQAAQGVTTEEWIGAPTDGYAAGDTLANDQYGLIANVDQLGLDTSILQAGQAYALAGDTILIVDQAGTVVSIVRRAAFPGRSNG